MHTSPYLQVATEKLWAGGALIGPGEFADRVDEVFADYACLAAGRRRGL